MNVLFTKFLQEQAIGATGNFHMCIEHSLQKRTSDGSQFVEIIKLFSVDFGRFLVPLCNLIWRELENPSTDRNIGLSNKYGYAALL